MLNNRVFWIAQMLVLVGFYTAAAVFAFNGSATHLVVKVAIVLLAAHVLEIPVAFYMLRNRRPQVIRVVFATILFGLIWWIPAKRGLLAVR